MIGFVRHIRFTRTLSTITATAMISLAMIAATLTGCSYPRALDPVFATRAGKLRMLNEGVAKFHQLMNWGNPGEAAEFVSPSYQGEFISGVLGKAVGQRITDIRLDKVDFPSNEDNKAFIYSTVRYYGLPSIQIKAYSAKQTWTYSRLDGQWLLESAERSDVNNSDPGAIGGFIR